MARLAAAVALLSGAVQEVAAGLDVKVTPGHIQRGYGKVRISVVDSGAQNYSDFFSYNSPFIHRWTDLNLRSVIKEVSPGTTTEFDIGGHKLAVRMPTMGSLTRGFFIADPCISSRDLQCPFLDAFQTFPRLVEVINTLVGSDEIDFWGVIGDNFYESKSPLAALLWEELTTEVKSKLFLAVPGNHDFWICGGPPGIKSDQMGYGFLQYYGQDTISGLSNSVPYDFSANPDALQIAAVENFVFRNQIGDIAFFGFSGAHTHAELAPHMADFCQWMTNAPTVNTAIVLGHWNQDDLGCQNGMAAPDVHTMMKSMPGCSEKLLMYVDGHQHCNQVTLPNLGFMIGGNGMYGCSQFGFMVLESNPNGPTGPEARVDYFEIARIPKSGPMIDNYNSIIGCLSESGYLGCRDAHGTKWRDPAALAANATLSAAKRSALSNLESTVFA